MTRAWRRRPRLGLGLLASALVLALSAHALGFWPLPVLSRLDLVLHDLRLATLGRSQPDHRIVLVDIDEQALAAHGRWPWPRALLAELIDRISGPQQAGVVALDVVLAEPDNRSSSSAPDLLPAEAAPGLSAGATLIPPAAQDNDTRLARSLQRWPVVLGFMLSDSRHASSIGTLPAPWPGVDLPGLPRDQWLAYSSVTGNLAQLQQAAGQAGHLNALVDTDGKLRRVPLLALGPDRQVYPSLALATAARLMAPTGPAAAPAVVPVAQPNPGAWQPLAGLRLDPPGDCPEPESKRQASRSGTPAALNPAPSAVPPFDAGLVAVRCGPLRVPLGVHGEVLLPFHRTGQPFTHWSAADVLADQLPPGALAGKVVMVGVSAPGLVDQRMTPVDDAMQGSVVHAHLLSALLDGQLRTVPVWAPLAEPLALAAVAGLMLWGLRRLGMVVGGMFTLGVMLALALANAAAWAWGHWALPLAASLLLPPLLLALHLALAYRAATGARAQLAQLFGQYVPPELVQEMSREPERHSMTSRSAELTVLFADVRGFSGLAERLPPGELSAMMNLLFSHLTDAVQAHRGTLDKYIGDAVMAFWGAPLDDPQHAEHAVAAALAMRARLPAMHAELRARGWPTVDVQIGINTGSMVVGDMGSRHRRAYTVMGDAVNLASRLQQLGSQEQLGVVVGDATQRALTQHLCLPLGRLQLRGRERAEQVWVALPWQLGDRAAVDQVVQLWQSMREATDSGDTPRALALLARIEALAPGLAPTDWQRRQIKAATGHGGH